MSSMYCWSLFGGRYIAMAAMMPKPEAVDYTAPMIAPMLVGIIFVCVDATPHFTHATSSW